MHASGSIYRWYLPWQTNDWHNKLRRIRSNKTNYQTIKTREQVYIYKNDTLTSFLKNKLGLNVFSIPLGFHISNSSKEAEKSCPFCVSDETDGSHSLAPFAPIIEFAAATRAVVLERVREVQRNHPKMARERESQAVRHPSIDRQKSLSRNEKEENIIQIQYSTTGRW